MHHKVSRARLSRILCLSFFALLQLFLGAASAETPSHSKPNIIFIMVDDLGKSLLPMYGAKSSVIKMPNLERLANEGVVFKNSYATHLCFSTRVKLVSGRSSLNTGAYQNQFPDGSRRLKTLDRVVNGGRTTGFYKYFYNGDSDIYPFMDTRYTPSFALPLKQAGYTTAVVGKWHLNDYVKQPRIFRTYGFDRWMISHSHVSAGAFTDKGYVTVSGRQLPEKMADFIIDFITENKHAHFFIYYPMHLVHSPYVMPLNQIGHLTNTRAERQIAMIEYVDLIIGRLMQTLEALNLKERTIIFFSGDNGSPDAYGKLYELIYSAGERKTKPFYGKGTLYEGGVNVPLIVSGGPVVRRGEIGNLADFTDILPTIADFAGVSVIRRNRKSESDYRGIDGQYVSVAKQYKGDGYSLVPFLTGATEDTARHWVMFASKETTVMRDQRFKLWANSGGYENQGHKLYDLHNDSYERNNLYDSTDPTIVAAKQRLENILSSLPKRSQIDAHFDPVDWNYGMLTHWSMDQPKPRMHTTVISDPEGGYDARGNIEIIFKQRGKLGEAIEGKRLYAPYSQGLFYSFVVDDNSRFFRYLSKGKFYRAVGKLIRTNRTLMDVADNIYNNWISPDEYFSSRGDREKFLSSMTLSAWVKTQKPEQTIYLLKQPYIGKEGNLMSFAISEDATVKFELTVDDKTGKLESKAIDEQLLGEWVHIAASWDGRDGCGEAVLYVNGESVAQACLGKPLSADDTDNLLLGGFGEESSADHSEILIDDIAIWRQPLMPMQIAALYELGNRFSYDASEVNSLFNTPEEDGITKIGDDVWQRTALKDIPDADRLIIRRLADAVEIQFGKVMAIRSEMDR